MAIANGKYVKALALGGELYVRWMYGATVTINKGTRFYGYDGTSFKIDNGNGVSKQFTGKIDEIIIRGGNAYAHVNADALYADYFLVNDILGGVKKLAISLLSFLQSCLALPEGWC